MKILCSEELCGSGEFLSGLIPSWFACIELANNQKDHMHCSLIEKDTCFMLRAKNLYLQALGGFSLGSVGGENIGNISVGSSLV